MGNFTRQIKVEFLKIFFFLSDDYTLDLNVAIDPIFLCICADLQQLLHHLFWFTKSILGDPAYHGLGGILADYFANFNHCITTKVKLTFKKPKI